MGHMRSSAIEPTIIRNSRGARFANSKPTRKSLCAFVWFAPGYKWKDRRSARCASLDPLFAMHEHTRRSAAGTYSRTNHSNASSRVVKVTVSRWENMWMFSMRS